MICKSAIVFNNETNKNVGLVAKDDSLEVYSIFPEQRRLQKISTPKILDKISAIKYLQVNRLSLIASKPFDSNNPSIETSSVGFLQNGNTFMPSAGMKNQSSFGRLIKI